MSEKDITVSQITKLGHRIKEVRERALLSLISKLKYGFVFDEEFDGPKELILLLIEWFQFEDSSYQEEVLQLLSNVLQAPSGHRFIRLIGHNVLLNKLGKLKQKISPKYTKLLEKIIRFIEIEMNTLNPEILNVPRLNMPFSQRSENICATSYDNTDVSSLHKDNDGFKRYQNNEYIFDLSNIGIGIYLMPWVELCNSDKRILKINEERFCKDKSKERAIYSFKYVLLKDFVPDVFLNRPTTVKLLQIMIEDEKFGMLSMDALSSYCDSILTRIRQLCDPSLKEYKSKNNDYGSRRAFHEEISSDQSVIISEDFSSNLPNILNQLPLPIFCFDTLLIVFGLLNKKISESLQEKNVSSYSVEEMNIAFSLNRKLFKILRRAICGTLWKTQETNTFKQDIVQRIIQMLHLCGEVLNKSKIHSSTLDRMCYLNMLIFCIDFANWCDYTPILPRAFVSNLFDCLDDISFACIYPKLYEKLYNFLKFQQYGNIDDQQKLKTYMDAKEITDGMNYAVKFLHKFETYNKSSKVVEIIKNSLPCLEFHKNKSFIDRILNLFSMHLNKLHLNKHHWNEIKHITLYLLAHNCSWIQEEFYNGIEAICRNVLGGLIKTDDTEYDESSLMFLVDSTILTEICAFGVEAKSQKVSLCAKSIIQYLLRGKLLVSDSTWKKMLEAILPSLPLLQTYADYDNDFGKAVVKTVDLKIGERMLIPKIEIIKGNICLLFSKCYTVQTEASKNLVKLLNLQNDEDMLPKNDRIRADVLCSVSRATCSNVKNFNVHKFQDANFYEEGALLQVLSLLKSNMNNEKDSSRVDPSICKSALAQLAVMLQQTNLHDVFFTNMGCSVLEYYFRSSLISSEYKVFPESALSCISVLNSLCYSNTSIRHWASEDQNILLNIIRTIFLYPNEKDFTAMAFQVLCLLSFSHLIVNSDRSSNQDENWTDNLSLHHLIVSKINMPFKCGSHSKTSPHRLESKEESMMKQKSIGSYIRIHWNVAWYGGLENVLKWPYVPESINEDFSSSLVMSKNDLTVLKATSGVESCTLALYQIQNATSYKSVEIGFGALTGYITLSLNSNTNIKELCKLPWSSTLRKFLSTTPANFKDLSVLLNFTNFLNVFLKLFKNGSGEFVDLLWIIDSILDTPLGLCSFLKKDNEEINKGEWGLISYKIRYNILNIIMECCKLCTLKNYETETKEIIWNNVIYYINNCLSGLLTGSMNSLEYAAQIVECLSCIVNCINYEIITSDDDRDEFQKLIENLVNMCESLFVKNDNNTFKGYSTVLNSLLIFSRLAGIQNEIKYWIDENNSNILSVCLLWQKSDHLLLKTLSLKIMSGIIQYSGKQCSDTEIDLIKYAIITLSDGKNASLLREQAAIFLCNFLATRRHFQKNDFDDECITMMLTMDFFNKISTTISNIYLNEIDEIDLGKNIPLNYLIEKEKYEVAHSKQKLNNIQMKNITEYSPKSSSGLIIGISDIIYNILLVVDESIPKVMMISDVFRTLFGCITLKSSNIDSKFSLCTSICRTLYKASEESQDILDSLLNCHDSINALIKLLNDDFTFMQETDTIIKHAEMFKWSFLLLGIIIDNPRGYNYICEYFAMNNFTKFLRSILISINDDHYKDVISSSLCCLVSLLNSYTAYHSDIDLELEEVFDTIVVPVKFNGDVDEVVVVKNVKILENIDRISSSDKILKSKKYSIIGEEFCKILLEMYFKYSIGTIEKRTREEEFYCIASALCNIIGISEKAKLFALERKTVERLLDNLNEIHNSFMVSTRPHSLIKNKKAPIVHHLNWTILLLCNLISNCDTAKIVCVEYNLISPIVKLWPWILANEMLRFHAIQMISSYTNSCPKASNSMCTIVGTTSLLADIINLLIKEMNLVSRSHSLVTLEGCLIVLKNVSCHAHCRNIILKSDVFNCLNRIHPAITKRQPQWRRVESVWENFCMTMSKYSDGQMKIAEHFDVICALITQADGIMLNVLRNCAFNSMNRPRYLGSAEILHIFSNILTSDDYSTDDKINVCIAVWALCANNHKSKLSLKLANITAKLSDCLHHLKQSDVNNENDRYNLQIMTYVFNMIKST